MENITKQKLISLVKEYAKDETVIDDYRLSDDRYFYLSTTKKFTLNLFKERSTYVHYENEGGYVSINSDFYNKLDYFKEKNVYSLVIKFEKLPDIIIESKKHPVSTKQKIKGKFLKFIPIDIDATILEDVYDYTLKCGHHIFEISFDEVKEIFEFIVEENRKFEEKMSNYEISKRFEKYNIK